MSTADLSPQDQPRLSGLYPSLQLFKSLTSDVHDWRTSLHSSKPLASGVHDRRSSVHASASLDPAMSESDNTVIYPNISHQYHTSAISPQGEMATQNLNQNETSLYKGA